MTLSGIALRPAAVRAILLGSDELGKGVAIECQRLGVEVIAVDCYADAPAIHVVHHSHVIDTFDGDALRHVVELERPHYIVPEIETIATGMLIQLEKEGPSVVPCARAIKLMMNHEGVRRLTTEELQLPTSTYCPADSENLFHEAVAAIGHPCIVKPVMSSSDKGQTSICSAEQLAYAWGYAQQGGRAGADHVVAESVVRFDFEIALLIVSAVNDVHFCTPVGHRQEDSDYRGSWQPQQVSPPAPERMQEIARKVVLALDGYGLFGVELFICGDEVVSSEVSPRPHDTGMMTLISQDLSELALHVRTSLRLPVGGVRQCGPTVSAVILPQLTGQNVTFDNIQNAVGADLRIRLFGKPEIDGSRRLGVAPATAESIVDTIGRMRRAAEQVKVQS